MRPKGIVTVSKIVDASGRIIPLDDAIRYGWLPSDVTRVPGGWGVDAREEACLGSNTWVDQGRQLLAYCFAFRSPISSFVCSKFGVGTGTTPVRVTDVALESPITLSTGSALGNVETVDFLSAFVVRVAFTLGLSDANGFLVTEEGLFSGGSALYARKIRSTGISKTSDFAPTLVWRIRM